MLKAMTFSELAQALSARVLSSDCTFNGVSIDSRNIQPGNCLSPWPVRVSMVTTTSTTLPPKVLSVPWYSVKWPILPCRNCW